MKSWCLVILAALILALPAFSGCDLLGLGDKKQSEADYYRQQLEAYKQANEAYQKAQAEYNENLRKGLQEYLDEYQKYQNNQTQLQLKQMEEALKKQQQQQQQQETLPPLIQ